MPDVDLLSDAAPATDVAPAVDASVPVPDSSDSTPTSTPVIDATPVTPDAPVTPEATDPNVTTPEDDDIDLLPQAAAEDPLSIKALNDKLTKSPELQAAFAKDPALRNLIYATARQAGQVQKYKEVFQTPELARTALDIANKQVEFEQALNSTPDQALDALYAMTAARDEQGNIRYDQPNPAYQAAITEYRTGNLWPHLVQMAEASGNEDWRDAVAIVAHQMLGDKIETKSTYAQAKQQQQAPAAKDPEVEAQLQRLAQMDREKAQGDQQKAQEYQTSIQTGIADSVEKAAKSYLESLIKSNPNVVLTDFIKDVVVEKAIKEIYSLAREDSSYKNHISFIFRSAKQKDDVTKTKIVSEATKYARERLPKLIAKHITEASKGIVATQQQRLDKQQKQQERTEVQSTAGVATPSRPDNAARIREFINAKKRKPTDRELLDF